MTLDATSESDAVDLDGANDQLPFSFFAFNTLKDNLTSERAKAYACRSFRTVVMVFVVALRAVCFRTGTLDRNSTIRIVVPTG